MGIKQEEYTRHHLQTIQLNKYWLLKLKTEIIATSFYWTSVFDSQQGDDYIFVGSIILIIVWILQIQK